MEFTLLYDGDNKSVSTGPVVLAVSWGDCSICSAPLDKMLREALKFNIAAFRKLMRVKGTQSAYFQEMQKCLSRAGAGSSVDANAPGVR